MSIRLLKNIKYNNEIRHIGEIINTDDMSLVNDGLAEIVQEEKPIVTEQKPPETPVESETTEKPQTEEKKTTDIEKEEDVEEKAPDVPPANNHQDAETVNLSQTSHETAEDPSGVKKKDGGDQPNIPENTPPIISDVPVSTENKEPVQQPQIPTTITLSEGDPEENIKKLEYILDQLKKMSQ